MLLTHIGWIKLCRCGTETVINVVRLLWHALVDAVQSAQIWSVEMMGNRYKVGKLN
jgi:hypothetical protein